MKCDCCKGEETHTVQRRHPICKKDHYLHFCSMCLGSMKRATMEQAIGSCKECSNVGVAYNGVREQSSLPKVQA